jgi:hypothetical protein
VDSLGHREEAYMNRVIIPVENVITRIRGSHLLVNSDRSDLVARMEDSTSRMAMLIGLTLVEIRDRERISVIEMFLRLVFWFTRSLFF